VSYRPLIAVVAYTLGPDRVSRWRSGGYAVPAPYIEALRRAGARTAIVSPGEQEQGSPEELLDPFDGLVLVGGGDINPARYGALPDTEHSYGVDSARDELEIALLLAADAMTMPVLCICRGMQLMNVAFGGTLTQHLPIVPGLLPHGVPSEDTQSLHDVEVEPTNRLFASTGATTLTCSSHHHQGVDRVGEGLVVTGRSRDGLVEAIERDAPLDEQSSWIVGVQWHPEDTAADDPAQQALFDAVTNLAKWRGSRARPGETRGRSRDYFLTDHEPRWGEWFEAEAAAVADALGPIALRVEHVGSTSVPGLAAKPVVDIQVSVARLAPRTTFVEPLEGLGYRFVADPVETECEYFSREDDPKEERKFHLRVCWVGSDWERRHLAFRDWLRAHPGDAAAYADLKRTAAAEHPNDVHTYTDAKTAFIRDIEARAAATADPAPPPA